jgi:uncharacterized protein (UPF0548 family)
VGLVKIDDPARVRLTVAGTENRAVPGAVVLLRAGGLRIPCRVVYTVSEADRQDFAYGTLPGHPEQGEEAFVVTMAEQRAVTHSGRYALSPASALMPPSRRWNAGIRREVTRIRV